MGAFRKRSLLVFGMRCSSRNTKQKIELTPEWQFSQGRRRITRRQLLVMDHHPKSFETATLEGDYQPWKETTMKLFILVAMLALTGASGIIVTAQSAAGWGKAVLSLTDIADRIGRQHASKSRGRRRSGLHADRKEGRRPGLKGSTGWCDGLGGTNPVEPTRSF